MQAASGGLNAPRSPPCAKESKLLEVILHAPEPRLAPLLACLKGWPLEAQADLANWRNVLEKLHQVLLKALQQCPRLVALAATVEKAPEPQEGQKLTDREVSEQVYEVLRFSAILLENAANKAVYPSADLVMMLLAARNDRIVFEATKVIAMLALPPQVHRYAADPSSFVEPAAGKNNLLRRRLLTVVQGRGTPKNSMEVVDFLAATDAAAPRDAVFQFYGEEEQEEAKDDTDGLTKSRVVTVPIPPYEEVVGPSTPPVEAACAAATSFERLVEQFRIPDRYHFQLFTQIRACYASRSTLTRENLVLERLHALLALFSLFSDAWDVTNYVEQHPELTRGVVELIRVESVERVPVRVRIAALLVLTALVNDRVGRAGGMGVLGRQSNVLLALGVAKGTPHGVFPSLVRFCMAELGDITAHGSAPATSGLSSPTPLASESADTDMEMSLAVAFVQATTDLLSPHDAEVVSAPPFRSVNSVNLQEVKLCWVEAVLGLLTAVVAIQSGAAVLTENGIVPALLHVLTLPSVSVFHMALTTQCVQALEITVSSHSAAAALYRDLNGVGILVDRLKLECASISGPKTSSGVLAMSGSKTVLLLAILASLSMSFHSQGVMSAGATSRAIREGSALNKVLLQLLANVDIFGPVIFAQAAIVVSDIINNDPSSVNHVHSAGLADAFLKTLTRWDIAELYPSRILLPPSSELLTAVPTVLNALCLTTTHAEKVAKSEPLMHLLDVFALPQYTEDETADYCFQGDTAAVVGAGVFELMRHVPSFQNAAIQAAVHALKKVIRFGEENAVSKETASSASRNGEKTQGILVRMATHVADLLEPLLSKSEHAAYFADLGGVRLLLALHQIILPSPSSFLDGALPKEKAAGGGLSDNSLVHNPAVQSITLALRSYASQQPTNLLGSLIKELDTQMDNLQRARAKVGLPWYLSESGEGAEGVLSSLSDIDLTELVGIYNKDHTDVTAGKVMIVGEYLRVLAVLEWLSSVLIWTLETAQTHTQSRRWFTDFTASGAQQTLTRVFRVDRSVQFERASLAALHQKKRQENIKEKLLEQAERGDMDDSMEAATDFGSNETALLTSDETGDSRESLFEPRKLTVQLHGMCILLKNRMDTGDEARGADGENSEIVSSLVSMGFPESRVDRALRQIQVNNVELAMEWILAHPEDEEDGDDDEKRTEDELQSLYVSLRDSFEAVCFKILRVQAARDRRTDDSSRVRTEAQSTTYSRQNLVKAIADYFSFLCSCSDEDRDLVIQRLNAAILDYFDADNVDEYLTMLTHLLALVLQLNSDSWVVMQLQEPSCVDRLVRSISDAGKSAQELSSSLSNDDVPTSNETKIDGKLEEKIQDDDESTHQQPKSNAFEMNLVEVCLNLLKRASSPSMVPLFESTVEYPNKAIAHAIWQLLSRLTLKYDLASYFVAHGGLDAVLDIPEVLYFTGYQELTCTLLSQALESPEVLERMMEDKIRRAITKLSTRFGAPSQMRITPRALLMEVSPFAARNDAVFLKALQNSVQVKKTESGRPYIVPRSKKDDAMDANAIAAEGQSVDQAASAHDTGASVPKHTHKLPKDHKHQAYVIVNKIIGRIHRLWNVEKTSNESVSKIKLETRTLDNEVEATSAGMCVAKHKICGGAVWGSIFANYWCDFYWPRQKW
ncbi:hypothetical protein PHYBOEH_003639 [Phytophthora boehmeriae]|uniref:UBA domain-containing protein n=1 Tax=Phytophthora boehmeriae TaxID=109152 RepID=A0A8T1WV81_9STRA|nr:hypothetical protein PHYBOEH_003639 [Phytophthora boehmeriae]